MTTITIYASVDARGLACPMPIVKTAMRIKTVPPGEFVEVLTTDPGSVKDLAAWSRATGNALVAQSVNDGIYRFTIQRA